MKNVCIWTSSTVIFLLFNIDKHVHKDTIFYFFFTIYFSLFLSFSISSVFSFPLLLWLFLSHLPVYRHNYTVPRVMVLYWAAESHVAMRLPLILMNCCRCCCCCTDVFCSFISKRQVSASPFCTPALKIDVQSLKCKKRNKKNPVLIRRWRTQTFRGLVQFTVGKMRRKKRRMEIKE